MAVYDPFFVYAPYKKFFKTRKAFETFFKRIDRELLAAVRKLAPYIKGKKDLKLTKKQSANLLLCGLSYEELRPMLQQKIASFGFDSVLFEKDLKELFQKEE